MILPSPDKRQWLQPNQGEYLGNIVASRNMNFDQRGRATLARRSLALINGISGLGAVASISTLTGETYYLVTDSKLLSVTLAGVTDTSVTMDDTGHTGGAKFDGLTWQSRWYVSQDTRFAYYTVAGGWTTGLGTLTSGNYHPMCVHEGLDYLAVGDGNVVRLYNNAYTGTGAATVVVTLPSHFDIRWIRYNNNYLYVGTKNTKGGDSMLFILDGVSTAASFGIRVPSANFAWSGTIYKGVLHIVTSVGQVLRFNGQGFDEVAHFPVYDTPYSWDDGNNSFGDGKIVGRGMVAEGNIIYFCVNGAISAPSNKQLAGQPSGLWVYDPDVGLYHRAGPSFDKFNTELSFSGVNTSTDVITVATYTAQTGTKVFLRTTNVGGLTASTFYYLIRVSGTTLKLATSYNNAIAGTAIDLTSGSTGTLNIHDDVTFGQFLTGGGFHQGAVAVINDFQLSVDTYKEYIASLVLFGFAGIIPLTTTTAVYTLQTLTLGYNRGTFTTVKIPSSQIKDAWQKIFVKFGRLFQGNDTIIIKYRTSDKENYPLYVPISTAITWTSTTVFTTTEDLTSVSDGDEIEIFSGRGAGCRVHISGAPSYSGGTWTVTLDEVIPDVTANDVSEGAMVDNWTKIGTGTSTDLDQMFDATIAKSAGWIQFKIELRGVSEPYVSELQALNRTQQSTVAQ